MKTKPTTLELILNDKTLTIEEVLTLTHPNYSTIVQNGRIVKLWSIMVTPELAKRILQNNVSNRPLNRTNLLFLKNEVINGRWKEISDSIQITSDDVVNNGQHRLTVIIDLNIPLPLRIETNVDASTFTIIDTGSKRTCVDTLAIKKVENTSVTATTIRLLKILATDGGPRTKVTNQDVVDFVDENPTLADSVKFGVSLYSKSGQLITASLLSTFHFALRKNYKKEAEEFLIKVALGNNIQPNCAAGALRSRFINLKGESFKSTKSEKNLEYIIVAWNKYINNEKVKSLKLPNEIPALIS